MALAKKCDRCGKLYEYYPIGNQHGVLNAIKCLRTDDEGRVCAEYKLIDLCPECMDEFNCYLTRTREETNNAKN